MEADDGTMIRSNLLVEPDPEQITFPMRVRLDIYPVGTDSQGSECVAFGFAPLQGSETIQSKSLPTIPSLPTVPQGAQAPRETQVPQAPQGAA